ncbi:signal transduction histidine kinase [Chitinophaga skermanii]|uniref:histidine kinase n=1 Tax=Chitinophaga skermanii TaxID=331697 RepID=A0A327R4L6_9BACT|nr:two-component regulator propeller domain-containing protein [Chitinophaga skermanii]RAJ10673.1 signal transduction histidine kinase [Chitinophaga skermanii]
MLKLKYCHLVYILLFLFLAEEKLGAQEKIFNHLTVEQSLSQNTVLCVAQDKRGFMWLGTRYGLNRFDGYQIAVYKTIPSDSTSISSNYINTILCDRDGKLWIGTTEGLSWFDAERNTFHRAKMDTVEKVNISAIEEDEKGRLWVGTARGVFVKQGNSTFIPAKKISNIESFKVANILRLKANGKGQLWVATSQKLYVVSNNKGEQFSETTFINNPTQPTTLSDQYVQAILHDRQGNTWVGTVNGLNKFDPATQTFQRYYASPGRLLSNNIRALMQDQTGKLWIGSQDGVNVMDVENGSMTAYANDVTNEKSLSGNSVHSVFEDRDGSVWVGTFYGGVNITHRSNTPFTIWQHNPQNGLSSGVISSIVSDDRFIWVGTEGGGLNSYNKATGKFTVYKYNANIPGSLRSNLVKNVYIDTDHHLWVGTHGGGLNLFDPATQTFSYLFFNEKHKHAEIVAFLEDSQGRFWIGGHPGLKVYKRTGTDLQSLGYEEALKTLAYKNISYLLEDTQHNIWIGALEGLYRFDHATQQLQAVPVNGRTNANINCVFQDEQGQIYIGLYNEGLALYQPKEEKFIIYTTKHGLPNNNVLGILEDEAHTLWISTSNGLTRFTPATASFQTYTKSDRLAGNEFNYNAFYKAPNGEMFFGGTKGLTSFFPGKIERNTKASALVFTGLKVFNTPVNVDNEPSILSKDIGFTDAMELKANQNTFTIEFALLNFIHPDKNKYVYKLEGIHKDWTELQNPSVTFINLPAGDYKLLVKSANNDGIWSKPVTMRITILPPFYKTWYAYVLYALLLAAILFFVTRFFYMRALLQRDKELHEAKLNFFTNISHEIRTHLTLIMAPIEKLKKEHRQNNILQYHLDHVSNNVHRLLKLVTELMDFRKVETSHLKLQIGKHALIRFLENIYQSFEDLSLAKHIRLSFTYDQATDVYFDAGQLEKVMYNLLSNAFKFTPSGGSIALQVEHKEDCVCIHVTDNGKGISARDLEKLFTNYFQAGDQPMQQQGYGLGLALSKSIVEQHKGKLTAVSTLATDTQEGYTRFTITLQKGTQHLEGEAIHTGQEEQGLQQLFEADITIDTAQAAKYTILITEDNTEVRELIAQTLSHYTLIITTDGQEGWQAAIEQIPDLIISDVMMPGMDGFTLCNQLKSDERTNHIPVVLLTAKSSQNDQIVGLNKGADVYLTKPFSTDVLALTVKNQLTTREVMREKFSKEFVVGPQHIVIDHSDEQFLNKLISLIEEHMCDVEFGVGLLAEKMAMSQSVLYKKLKAVTDMSVNDFAKTIRLKKAAQLLALKTYSVFEVSVMVGFNDRKYFSKEFKKQFGYAPSGMKGE